MNGKLDIIGNKHKVRKKARSNKEIDVFQGKIADFSRYLSFSQAVELFPIMSIERGLDPNNANDGKGDRDGDEYTNVEEYLDWLVIANTGPSGPNSFAVPAREKLITTWGRVKH